MWFLAGGKTPFRGVLCLFNHLQTPPPQNTDPGPRFARQKRMSVFVSQQSGLSLGAEGWRRDPVAIYVHGAWCGPRVYRQKGGLIWGVWSLASCVFINTAERHWNHGRRYIALAHVYPEGLLTYVLHIGPFNIQVHEYMKDYRQFFTHLARGGAIK